MTGMLIKIMIGLGTKFLTERFVSKMAVTGLRSLVKSTKNRLDDQAVDAIADALGVVERRRGK